jgi:hypothetical protein
MEGYVEVSTVFILKLSLRIETVGGWRCETLDWTVLINRNKEQLPTVATPETPLIISYGVFVQRFAEGKFFVSVVE